MRLTIPGLTLLCNSAAMAQTKQPVPPGDYSQWESLVTFRDFGGLSPDGKWLAYGINRSNRNNELRVLNVADGTTKTAPFGSQPVFSSDSRWVAYSIGYFEAQEEKMKKDKKPVQKKLGLLNLATGDQTVVDAIESFAFSPNNSAVFGVQNMTTPLLIEIGDSDGTVFFRQGVELYNIARRAGKDFVLIEYFGEDHGLRKKPNQIDYRQHIFTWFGHYLKDEPAAQWISKGESFLEHERELKKLKAAGGKD